MLDAFSGEKCSRKASVQGGECSACGVVDKAGLIEHGSDHLCILCDACKHLELQGGLSEQQSTGTMIWLPNVRQSDINLLCRVLFSAVKAMPEGKLGIKAKSVYGELFSAAEELKRRIGPEFPHANNPLWIAQNIQELKQANAMMSSLGIRFLPKPNAFIRPLMPWIEEFLSEHPIESWTDFSEMKNIVGTSSGDVEEFGV